MKKLLIFSLFMMFPVILLAQNDSIHIMRLDSAFYNLPDKSQITSLGISNSGKGSDEHIYTIEEINYAICMCPNLNEVFIEKVEMKQFPECLLKLKNLETLTLNENGLKKFPNGILQLYRLKYLEINDNPINKIPSGIYRLKLKSLTLSGDDIKCLPSTIGKLESLSLLNISGNKSIKIPHTISQLDSLKYLDLNGCSFNKLPESILNLKNLVWIRLDESFLDYEYVKQRLPSVKVSGMN